MQNTEIWKKLLEEVSVELVILFVLLSSLLVSFFPDWSSPSWFSSPVPGFSGDCFPSSWSSSLVPGFWEDGFSSCWSSPLLGSVSWLSFDGFWLLLLGSPVSLVWVSESRRRLKVADWKKIKRDIKLHLKLILQELIQWLSKFFSFYIY